MADVPLTRATAPMAPIPATDQRSGDPRFARRFARRRSELIADEAEPQDLPDSQVAADPAQALLEGLDRLRVINLIRPADIEYSNAVRAMKAYRQSTDRIERVSDGLA